MERLKYVIEDNTIVELLGIKNFTNKESAMLELVKNAFDAKATNINIVFTDDMLIIEDNGDGMNADDIKKHWMHVGKSDKDYKIIDNNNNVRVLAGSKGIGRFALSRLGSSVELYSQEKNRKDKSVLWITDWNESILEKKDSLKSKGTKIIIKGLRDNWNKNNVYKLSKYLSRTYNDTLMKVNIIFRDENISVERYFMEPKLGYNCTSKINLKYLAKNQKLICIINSDEFKEEAKVYCHDINLINHTITINIFEELVNNKEIAMSQNELKKYLEMLGDFSAEFYFSLKDPNTKEMEKFLYKYKMLSERYEEGIILYRNSFSISSYDGTKDWLRLGRRSRLSPAAATHPTGAWRVRENQLSGMVKIDKKVNVMLEDLSNRQGLDENDYYQIFIKILQLGISQFERYRQSIIRKINTKNILDKEKNKKITEEIIRNPNKVKKLSNDEVNKFISEIKEYKEENSNFKKEIVSTEQRYKYDVRILNVLATSGLKATSIAHEVYNDRNSISENCDDIISAMKEFGIWDFINEKERTQYAYSNIPQLIEKNRRVNLKIIAFMNTILTEVKKSQFVAERYNILELINEIKSVWKRDYSWIEIEINIESFVFYTLPKDLLKVIFDNLILNSIQQNENRNHLNIYIKCLVNSGMLTFLYKDDGSGLDKKYINKPMQILEVHETSRNQGHGLGMWIVNNTVVMSGGKIEEIDGINGFKIKFSIGGKI
ncbi:sensor histidine kinase [Clostridium ihumii]|uniref:sensor histidine kinase n=1 Tax=Clostridium ihumii TaxID=1470356 RepID=UPI003D331F5A